MKCVWLLLCSLTLCTYAQTDRYKLTEKDTIITCGLTSRGTVTGPFSDVHTADFENLVTNVFKASPFPAEPYSLYKMKAAGDLRIGKHTYDDIDFHTFLLYNLDSVSQFNYKAKSKYALMTVLAHEAGHHSLHHFMPKLRKSISIQELQADFFSGWLMAKFNVPKADVTKGIASVADNSATNYPLTKDRLNAVLLGFELGTQPKSGGPLSILESNSPLTNEWLKKWARVIPEPAESASLLESSFDKQVPELQLDTQGQLIYKQKDKHYVIARAIPSKDQRYGYLLFDNQFNYWFIFKDGSIKTADESKTLAQVNVGILN